MRRLLFRLVISALTVGPALLQAGTPLRLNSPQISIQVGVPDGWTVDVRSAFQIAQFTLHEIGTNWRDADLVVFGRFVPRGSRESGKQFLESEEKTYIIECPFLDIRDIELNLDTRETFLVKSYVCPGKRKEMVAVVETPRHFVIFVLTAQGVMPLEAGLEPFKEVLSDFRWLGGQIQRPLTPPPDHGRRPSE